MNIKQAGVPEKIGAQPNRPWASIPSGRTRLVLERVLGALCLMLLLTSTAHAVDLKPKYWSLPTEISGGLLTSAPTVVVTVGETVSCEVSAASDSDHWVKKRVSDDTVYSQGDEADTIHYAWTANLSGGTFSAAATRSASWKAPLTPGHFTLTCTTDDGPTAIVPPEDGDRDDAPVTQNITVHVVRKEWSVGAKPGNKVTAGVESPGSIITSPQDQSGTYTPALVVVNVGQQVPITMQTGSDYDHWERDDNGNGVIETSEKGDEAEALTYSWIASGGSLTGATTSSPTWTAPSTIGDAKSITYTLTCTIDDAATPVEAPDHGSRADNAETRSISIIVAQKIWDADKPIGNAFVEGAFVEDGKITAPQNQTGTPTPVKVFVLKGATVSLAIADATDLDHWVRDVNGNGTIESDEQGYVAEDVTYKWTVTGAGTDLGTLAGDTSKTPTWTASAVPGVYTLTCTVTDAATAVTAPDRGTRDDAAPQLVRQVEITVLKVDLSYGGVAEDSEEDIGAKIGPSDAGGLSLSITPAQSTGEVTLTGPAGDKPLRVWTDATKTQRLTLPKKWVMGVDTMPTSVYVEARDASAAMRDIGFVLTYKNLPDEAAFSDTVKMTIARLDFEVKHKGAGSFAASALTAAGGADSDVHKAEIRITAKLPDESTLAGATVTEPVDISVGHGDAGTTNPDVHLNASTTGLDGTVTGTYLSGNRTETEVVKVLYGSDAYATTELRAAAAKSPEAPGASATVGQIWNALSGTSDHVEAVGTFNVGEPFTIKYLMKANVGNGPEAIDKHGIYLETTSITGLTWVPDPLNPNGGDWTPVHYDASGDGSIGPDGMYSGLVTVGDTSETAPGTYETQLTVKDYFASGSLPTLFVEDYGLDAVDGSTVRLK